MCNHVQMQEFLEVLKSYTSWYLWQGQISVDSFDLFCKANMHDSTAAEKLQVLGSHGQILSQWTFQVLDVGFSC